MRIISSLKNLLHRIFSTTNVELLPVANFKNSSSSKKNHLQKGDFQLKRFASKSLSFAATLLLFSSVGFSQSAGFNNTFIVLSLNGGANTFYDLNAATANTDFNGANLGTFAAGTSNLVLKGAEHNVFKCGGADLTSTRLNYRIYPTASPSGSYTAQSIGFTSGFNNGCGGQDQVWSNTGLTTNLLTGLGTGSYTIEVFSDATITCCGGTAFASNAGNNYKATFTVSSIVWTNGAALTAWYTNTNWTPNTAFNQWLTGSVAEFQNAGTATLAGINLGTASLSIGAIDITSARTRALTINNSSVTTGTLTLNGVSLGSNSNVILRNNAASSNLLTIQNGSGTMNVALGNATTNVIDAASPITISSNITGASRSITKIGSGTLTLSGTNTYSGGTIISGGTVSAGAAANLGDATGAITLGNGATSATLAATGTFTRNALNVTTSSSAGVIDVAASQTLTLAALNTLSGTDNTTKFGKSGAGTLTLSGAGSYVGQTQIGQGTVIVSNNAGLGTNTSTAARGIDLGLNVGDISQANNVSVLATNGITVPQSIYVAPNTTAATRTIGTSGASASANFSNEVYLDGTATLAPVSGGTLTMSGNIINTGGLTTTTGTTVLSGTNTYSGTATVSSGTLRIGSTSALGSTAAGTSITSGAVLDLNGINYSSAEALNVNGTGISSGGAIINSSATGATYAGLLTLGSASRIVGGTGTIAISNTGTITGSTFGLTLGGAQGGSVASIIGTGTGTLTKLDAGTWTLSGANTYTGATTISGGTLRLGAAGVIADGSAISLGGGTLSSGASAGFSETMGTLALTANSIIALGTGNHTLTFANSSAVSWTAATTLTITGWSGTAGASGTAGRIFVGVGGLTAGQLGQISFSGFPGTPIILGTGELVPPSAAAGTYAWNATSGSADWTTPGSWTPARNTPNTGDVLNFTNAGSSTALNVPTQTIARMVMSNSTSITLQAAASGNTLSIDGGAGTDLDIPAGSAMTIGNGANALSVVFNNTGNTATVAGTLSISNANTSNTFNATNSVTTVSGILNNGGVVTTSAAADLVFNSGSTYNHTHTATGGIVPTATWNSGSTMAMIGYTSPAGSPSGLNQTFHHFLYNCAAQTSVVNLNLTGAVTMTCNGNFTVQSTGSSRLMLNDIASNYFLIIGGSFNFTGGNLDFAGLGGATIEVTGNFVHSSTGVLDIKRGAGGVVNINLLGNFTHSAGSMTKTDVANATFNFNSLASTQIINQTGGTYTGSTAINFNLGNFGATTIRLDSDLNLGSATGGISSLNGTTLNFQTNRIFSSGLFIAASGTILRTAITDAGGALTISAASGSVRSTTRTYQAGVNYYFSGAAAQVAGDALGANTTGNITIDNLAGVSLNTNATMGTSSVLALTNGRLNLGSNNLTLGTAGSISGTLNATNMVVAEGSGELRKAFGAAGSFTFPVGDVTGTVEYSPITLNFTSGTFASAYAGVRLTDAIHPSNGSTTDYLTRFWNVSTSGITGFNCTYSANYLNADITGTEANFLGGLRNTGNTAWICQNAVNAASNLVTNTVSDFQGGAITAGESVVMGCGVPPVTIWSNTITGTSPGLTNPYTTGDVVNSNLTVSGIGRAGITGSAANDRYNSTNWPTGALDLTKYFEFTLTPNVGYLLNLNSFIYTGQLSTGTATITIRSSIDGYTANIGSPTSSGTTISLTDLAYQNISGPITFRVYANALTATTTTYSINDFSFTGNLSLIGTITTGTVSGSPFCAGATGINVPFTYTPAANFPNGTCTFTAQLSDASGSFTAPTNLQSVSSNASGSQSITATIPTAAATGTGYRIRVVSASPTVNGSNNGSNISISNSTTSIAPTATQNIITSTNGTTLTVTEGSTVTSRQWKYSTVSGGPYTNNLGTATTQIPNFAFAGTYYIVCESTYGAPCSTTKISNEVQINVTGSTTFTWNGSTGSGWNTAANWTPNGIPGVTDIVVIDAPGTNILDLASTNQTILDFSLTGTGTFSISGNATLTITGTVASTTSATPSLGCSSTISIANAASQTIPAWNFGNLNATGGDRILASSGTIGICGTFTRGAGAFTVTGSTVNYNGTGAQTISAGTYNNLTISNARGAANLTSPAGTIAVGGTFNISTLSAYTPVVNAASIFDFTSVASQSIPAFFYGQLNNSGNGNRTWASSGIIDINQGFTPGAGIHTITGSTVRFSNTAAATLNLSTFTTNIASRQYNNLIINGGTSTIWSNNGITLGIAGNLNITSGTYLIGSPTGSGTVNIDGNLTIDGGILNVSNTAASVGTINLLGNYSISSGTFNKSSTTATGTINFSNGSLTQTISQTGGTITNSGTIWNLGTGSTTNTVELATNVTMSGGTINANNSATVDFKTFVLINGTFVANSGTTLVSANTNATGTFMISGANGSVQSTTRTFSNTGVKYIFNGASAQISGNAIASAASIDGLTINNASGVTLSSAPTISATGLLTLSSGLLNLGNFNLTVSSGGTITGQATNRYICTNGTGQLRRTVAASNTIFPVGLSAYNPISLNNSGTSDIIGVIAADAITPSLNNTNLVVNRSWNITETAAGGSNLSVTAQWNGASEQAAGFGAGTTNRIAVWTGTAWTQVGATQAGSNPFTFTSTSNFLPAVLTPASYTIAIGKDDAFNCTTPPTLTSVSAPSGFAGDVLTLNGTGLTGLTGVTIGGSAATINSQAGTSASITVGTGATGTITVSTSPVCSATSAFTFTFNGFITATTGNWNTGSTWQGGTVPTAGSAVTILNTHNVTLNTNASPSGVTINSGGTLTLNNATNTINLGAGTLLVNGTLSVTSAVNAASARLTAGTLTIGTGGVFTNSAGNAASVSVTTFNVNSGATYNHDALGSSTAGVTADFPGLTGGANITINSNATINFTKWGIAAQSPPSAPTVVSGQWGNLTINIASQNYSGSWQNSGAIPNATSLNILATGTRDFRLTTANSNYTGTFGSINVSGGILSLCSGGSTGAGTIVLNVGGNTSISGGNLSIHGSAGSSDANTSSVTANFNGNVSITGGTFYCLASNSSFITYASGNSVVNFNGNLDISNATFDHAFLPAYITPSISTGAVSVNLKGNFNLGSGSTLSSSNSINTGRATTTTFNFNKASGTQTFDESGTVSNHAIAYTVSGTSNTLLLNTAADLGNSALGSFTVNAGTTLDCGANVLSAGGTFTAQSGSTLRLGNANGITAAPTASGNIQFTTARNFNGGANYTYTGSVNQVTGTGLPTTLVSPGQITIANTGGAGNNTVTLTTNGTTTPTLNLQSGLFAIGTGSTINIANTGNIAVSGGDFATGTTGGTVNCQGAATFSGNSNPYNVYTSGGVNFGTGTVTIQNGGTFRINSGGFVNTNAPFYASGSTLEYNTGGNYDRGLEWSAASGRGYPHHVTVLNTTLIPAKTGGAYASTAFNTGGNLTINSGANVYMDFGGNNMFVPLTINGNLSLIGNLSGSGAVGGDVRIRGNWINNGTGANFFPNSRAVFFDGSTAQTLGGTNATVNPFGFVILSNFNGLTLLSSQQLSNDFTFIAGSVTLGNFNLTMATLNAAINGVTAANYFVTNGTGQLFRNFNNTNTTFPVGPSITAYSPIILNQAGTPDNIGVRAKATPPFGQSVNDVNEMIEVEYYLTESVAGGNSLFTGLQWNLADEGSTFNRNSGVYHGTWTGSAWQVRASNPTFGSNPYFSNSTANYTGNLSNTLFAFGNINGFFSCLQTATSGDWNTGSTWNGGAVPSTDANVCLLHNVTMSTADATISNVTINVGGALNIGAAFNLDLLTLGSVVNNSGSAANLGSGTVRFLGTGSFAGTSGITATNVQLNGNTTFNAGITTTITGNLTMNSGSFITSGSPTYSATSTLIYNNTGSYNVSTEWTGNSTSPGLGIPQNVTIQNGTTVNMPNGNRGLAGNLNVSNGTLALNGTSGDLYVGGNWNRAVTSVFTPNNRAVFFNGSSNQTISVTGGGTETFAYMLVTKTGGSLLLDNVNATDVTINASTGNVLQVNGGNTLDLNGRTLLLSGTAGNFNIPSGAASVTGSAGSVFAVNTGIKTVTAGAGATLNFGPNVRVALSNGLDFGSNTSTVQGILQIANGGFVSTNPPTYAAGSTLRYFTGGNFSRSTEWSTASGPGYPHNVEVQQNGTVTTLDVSSGSTPLQIEGNLTINTGGIVTMNNRNNPLIVKGNVSVGSGASGTLVLSSVVGGDIQIAGNLSRIDAGLITQNGREIEMNGTTPQTIGGISSFEFLKINNSGSNVIIGAPITINNRLSLVSGTFIQNSYSVTMANGSKIMRSGGFMLEPPVVVGTDQYDMEYQATVTTDVEYLGNEEIRDLIIGSGITVTLQSNKTFNRNLDLAGDLNLGTSTLTARGKATNPSFSGSINLTGGGTRLITGSAGSRFNITGLGLNTPLAYTKTFSSFGSTLLNFDSNVLVRIGDGAVDFGTGNPVTINGVLQVLLGGSVGQSLNSCFYGTNSTLRFANTVDYQVGATDKTWSAGAINSGTAGIPWNVDINDGGTDLTLNDTRALRGNLTITSGTFTLSNTYTGSFNIGGNWTRSGATSSFNNSFNKKVVFDRQIAGDQTITTSTGVLGERFYDLEVSPFGDNVTLGTSTALEVINNLNFVSGKLNLSGNALAVGTASANGSISNGNSSAYIVTAGGTVKQFTNTNTAFAYPVGDVTNYSPMHVTLDNGAQAGASITVSVTPVAHPNAIGTNAATVFIKRFWSVVPNGLALNPVYDVEYRYADTDPESGVELGLRPVKYSTETDSAGWIGSPGSGASAIDGTTANFDSGLNKFTWDSLTTFSDFSAAGNGAPLPIELLSFDAQPAGNTVLVNWTTASEINNDFFTIERSADAINYNAIGMVDGAGNSNSSRSYQFIDEQPLQGVSYYRLRQTDFNGTTEVFDPAVVNFNAASAQGVSMFPNPAVDYAHVMLQSEASGNGYIRITDLSGRIVFEQNVNIKSGVQPFTLETRNLSMGTYLVTVSMADGRIYTLPLVKN